MGLKSQSILLTILWIYKEEIMEELKDLETQHDNTGECYGCHFLSITGEGEHEETHCNHPTPRNTGCVDEEIIYVVKEI